MDVFIEDEFEILDLGWHILDTDFLSAALISSSLLSVSNIDDDLTLVLDLDVALLLISNDCDLDVTGIKRLLEGVMGALCGGLEDPFGFTLSLCSSSSSSLEDPNIFDIFLSISLSLSVLPFNCSRFDVDLLSFFLELLVVAV